MNNEIKEILEKLENNVYYIDNVYYRLFKDEAHLLLDYITNLQQENGRLKQTQYIWSYDLDMQLEDYKSRCEKAIEFIENKLKYKDKTIYENDINWLLNILQGENNE